MASTATILDDIGDKFCQCCLCFEQYKDPRQLPCFHRYCGGCLDKEITRNNGELKCPLCQQEVEVPEDGAQGLKKDFFMNEIIEFLELKKSFQDEGSHKCGDCSKDAKATSFCFRCSDFLCDGCNEYHLTKKSLKEHRPYLLTLKDIETKHITLQKLSSLKQAPTCETHPDDVSRLCCKTCGNMPVCLACTYGDHKTHEIEDVISFARAEKKRLRSRLALLDVAKDKIRKTSEKMGELKNEVISLAERNTAEEKLPVIFGELEVIRRSRSNDVTEIRDRGISESLTRGEQHEEKIMQLRREHELHEQKCKEEIETEIAKSKEVYRVRESQLLRKQGGIQKEVQEGKTLIENERRDKLAKTEKVLGDVDSTVKRLQNLAETGFNILVSENNWTTIQNVERICSASDVLLQDAATEFPDLVSVLEYPQVRLSIGRAEKIRISGKPEIQVNIKDIKRKGWFISGVAATEDGTIVITGGVCGQEAHISVISLNGKIVKQKLIGSNHTHPNCYCASFKGDKVAVATEGTDIGLYATRDNTYHNVNLRDLFGNKVRISCIAADGETNLIAVGCTDHLNMLDDKLELVRTMNLPENIKSPSDIAMSNGKIFVCGVSSGVTACAVSMKGELLYKLPCLRFQDSALPCSVCSDSNGFVYILWVPGYSLAEQDCALAQYRPDDGHLMSTTKVRTVQGWITAALIDGEEKLLLPTEFSGELRAIGLYEE